MLLDEVTFALEGFCMALTDIIPVKFHVVRQAADVISVLIVVILTLIFNISWSIGIGTILGMLTFGPTLGIFMKIFKPILKKQGLDVYKRQIWSSLYYWVIYCIMDREIHCLRDITLKKRLFY